MQLLLIFTHLWGAIGELDTCFFVRNARLRVDGEYQFEFTWHHQYIQETAETVVEIKFP